jgi:hypothetical protein
MRGLRSLLRDGGSSGVMLRVAILVASLGLLAASDHAQARKGCGHEAGTCYPETYPPAQVLDAGWCESHFVTDRKGNRVHCCPAK